MARIYVPARLLAQLLRAAREHSAGRGGEQFVLFSVAPPGLAHFSLVPRAGALGCNMPLLRSWIRCCLLAQCFCHRPQLASPERAQRVEGTNDQRRNLWLNAEC